MVKKTAGSAWRSGGQPPREDGRHVSRLAPEIRALLDEASRGNEWHSRLCETRDEAVKLRGRIKYAVRRFGEGSRVQTRIARRDDASAELWVRIVRPVDQPAARTRKGVAK